MDRSKLRRQVEDALGGRLRDVEWEVVEADYVPRWEEGPRLIEDLIDDVRKLRGVFGSSRRRVSDPPRFVDQPPRGYAEAVSALVAMEAAEDDEVAAFRERVLRGHLLRWDQIDGWITARSAARSTSRSRRVTSRTFVPYIAPGVGNVIYKPAPDGSELQALAQIADRFRRTYTWDPAQAVVFILTGVIPYMAPIRTTIDPEWPSLGATQRIVLTIDPTTTPVDVARAYRKARRAVMPGERVRALTDKHAQLAVFAEERRGQTWKARMRAWNREAKKLAPKGADWTYSVVQNFARDATAARRRLLRPTDKEAGPDEGTREGGR